MFYLSSDTMDKWDQNKLEEVIEKKHGEKEKSMPKTEIVSTIKCPYNNSTCSSVRNECFIQLKVFHSSMISVIKYLSKLYSRFVNSFWKLSRRDFMAGSGIALMVQNVSTGMHFHQALC